MDLVKINNVEIDFSQEGEIIYVPIKPICEVLGIDHSGQVQMIKSHPILSSVVVIFPTTGSDGKTYQMLNLPLKYFFGWLFSINARNVKSESYETVVKYQQQVFDVIYDKFYLEPIQQKKKLIKILEKENKLLDLRGQVKELNAEIKSMKDEIDTIKMTDPTQLTLDI